MGKNYRIKDIAILAGVSTGTVDRILHKRGKVSEEAQKKVEKVLKEIDYHPNLIARSLALKKNYRFVVLIPHYQEGEYWAKLIEGIDKAEEELNSYNIEVVHTCFNQYDKTSFDQLCNSLNFEDYQGVIIATLFEESVKRLTSKLDQLKIPYTFVDSLIENLNCLAYYGTNSYDSGYIAGRLLSEQAGKNDDIVIFRFIRRGDQHSTQVLKREEGFRDYLSKNSFTGNIYQLQIHADNQQKNIVILNNFFDKHPQVKKGIIFNSRVHLLGEYFSTHHPELNFRLIGYDVIDANIEYLNKEVITHLIAQRPEVQGFNSIRTLFRHLVLEETPLKINYMPIDILVKENISYYNNYL